MRRVLDQLAAEEEVVQGALDGEPAGLGLRGGADPEVEVRTPGGTDRPARVLVKHELADRLDLSCAIRAAGLHQH